MKTLQDQIDSLRHEFSEAKSHFHQSTPRVSSESQLADEITRTYEERIEIIGISTPPSKSHSDTSGASSAVNIGHGDLTSDEHDRSDDWTPKSNERISTFKTFKQKSQEYDNESFLNGVSITDPTIVSPNGSFRSGKLKKKRSSKALLVNGNIVETELSHEHNSKNKNVVKCMQFTYV